MKVVAFAVCMLVTGSINTIATKYQDMFVIGHTSGGIPLTFKHPAVQSACMFFGETLCLIPYFYLRWKKRSARRKMQEAGIEAGPDTYDAPKPRSFYVRRILVFAIPAMCDACATTLLNVGLYYTFASTYQMLRGTMVLFAGMFTILILRRSLHTHHWLGMVLIMAGAALVGASSVLSAQKPHQRLPLLGPLLAALAPAGATADPPAAGDAPPAPPHPSGASAPLFGDILVVLAQLVAALQFILEEKFLKKYKVPTLLAVGVEGCWGVLLSAIALPLLSYVNASDGRPVDDALAAVREIAANPPLAYAVWGSTVSIAFFNFFGISVTKHLSGAARATIDACRTIFIWLFSLQVGWERFHPLEVVGFVVLLSGTSLYNEILRACLPAPTSAPDPAHYHQHPPHHPGHPRRRPTADSTADDTADALTQPLLAPPPAAATQPLPVRPARARALPFRPKGLAAAGADGEASGSDIYTMARSMRLGASALSPHSLDSFQEQPSSLAPESFSASYSGVGLAGLDPGSGAGSPASTSNSEALATASRSQANLSDLV